MDAKTVGVSETRLSGRKSRAVPSVVPVVVKCLRSLKQQNSGCYLPIAAPSVGPASEHVHTQVGRAHCSSGASFYSATLVVYCQVFVLMHSFPYVCTHRK